MFYKKRRVFLKKINFIQTQQNSKIYFFDFLFHLLIIIHYVGNNIGFINDGNI